MNTGITWAQARRAARWDTVLDTIQGIAFTLALLLLLAMVGGIHLQDEMRTEAEQHVSV